MCEHTSFAATCHAARLSEIEGGPITGYVLSVTLACSECNLPFRFRGIPAGNDPDYPRVSLDGCELRAPLEPADTPKFAAAATYRLPPEGKLQ